MELTFQDRIKHVAGDSPYTWASQRGIKKSSMTSLLNSDKPQHKTLLMLEERTGIPLQWWLHGDLPPPEPAGAGIVYVKDAESPMPPRLLLSPPAAVGRINADALAAIIEGALKTAPRASPAALAAHCAKVYAQALADGLITPDGAGPAGRGDGA